MQVESRRNHNFRKNISDKGLREFYNNLNNTPNKKYNKNQYEILRNDYLEHLQERKQEQKRQIELNNIRLENERLNNIRLEKEYLKQFYWKKQVLWTGGYFCSTIGEVSEKTLIHYIETQG